MEKSKKEELDFALNLAKEMTAKTLEMLAKIKNEAAENEAGYRSEEVKRMTDELLGITENMNTFWNNFMESYTGKQ